jgi:hypothetical protein
MSVFNHTKFTSLIQQFSPPRTEFGKETALGVSTLFSILVTAPLVALSSFRQSSLQCR